MPLAHYEESDPRSSKERSAARLRNVNDRIATFFVGVPKEGICDVGTGEGTFLAALKRAGGSGVGIEPGKRYRDEAKEQGVRIVGETIADVPRVVKEESIQTLTLFHVIEHLERPDETMQMCYQELPEGGYLILETPNISSPILKAKNYEDSLIYPEHLYYFNEDNLHQLITDQGFTVVAQGRRDFDQYHMPISESLRRLRMPEGRSTAIRKEGRRGMLSLREWIRAVLARRVIATGRLNYMWFVAKK